MSTTFLLHNRPFARLFALAACGAMLAPHAVAQVAPPPPADFSPSRLPMEMSMTMSGASLFEAPDPGVGAKFFVDPLASIIPAIMPPMGDIVEEAVDPVTGVWSAWLSNGVRLHVRSTPLPPGTIARDAQTMMRITLYGAEVLEDGQSRGLTEAASALLSKPLPIGFRANDIEKALLDRTINWESGSGPDMLYVQGSAPRKYLGWLMQFAHLAIAQPQARSREFASWRRDRWTSMQVRKLAAWTSIYGEFGSAINPTNDPRLVAPTLEHIGALTAARAREWLLMASSQWPMEIAIDGPIDIDSLKGDIRSFFASLPARERVSPQWLLPQRTIAMPALPLNASATVIVKGERAASVLAAPAPDESQVLPVQALQLAADMLESRIRSTIQKVGPSTTPTPLQAVVVGMAPGGAYPGRGLFSIALLSNDATTEEAIKQAMPAIDDMYEQGPRELEFAKTQKAFVDEVQARWKGQQVWVQALSTATYTGLDVREFAMLPQTVASITRDQVHQAFREVWSKPTPLTFTLLPEIGKRPGPLQRLPDGQTPLPLPQGQAEPAPATIAPAPK